MFGEMVRAQRRRLGMTQEELAERSGVSVRNIGKLESGRISAPRAHTVRALADALELPDADRTRFYESAVPLVPAPAGSGAATSAAPTVPAQLPADVTGFVGRAEHLAYLDALLAEAEAGGEASDRRTAVVISAVSGTAGVGKTALAVHWAHTVAERFPDGQLYVNLRGFDPDGRIMEPAEALRALLDGLGVRPDRLPSELDAQIGLYRSLLAGRRILVVLDNARDAEQVRPLLPATATAMAVVTSRHQLTGLVAANAAHPLLLEVLSAGEARELLVQRIGVGRVGAEPAAVEEIMAACARLPLALAITAARARQTHFPLAALASDLREAGHRLDMLDAGSATGQVRAVLSWSYHALGAPAARLFRLLGLHRGPDISAAAAAALAGLPDAETRQVLAELVRANMVVEHLHGRYTFHDLLRVYAAELTAALDRDTDRNGATVRMLDHYVHTAHAADRLLNEGRDGIEVPLAPTTAGSRPRHLADYGAAVAWLSAEHRNLSAAVEHAADAGHDTQCWQLAWALDTFLVRLGRSRERMAAWQTALHAAERLDDTIARAFAHIGIAGAAVNLGLPDVALPHLRHALDLHTRAGHRPGMARTHHNLSHLYEADGPFDLGLSHMRQAHALYRSVGNKRGQGRALGSIAWLHVQTGEHPLAVAVGQEALALGSSIDDHVGVMHVLDTLGWAHHHLGDLARAAAYLDEALTMAREFDDRRLEGLVLDKLGATALARGELDAARTAWTRSLSILSGINYPNAAEVRRKLAGLPGRDTAAAGGAPDG